MTIPDLFNECPEIYRLLWEGQGVDLRVLLFIDRSVPTCHCDVFTETFGELMACVECGTVYELEELV